MTLCQQRSHRSNLQEFQVCTPYKQRKGVWSLSLTNKGKEFEVWALQTEERSLQFEPYKQRKGVWSLQPYRLTEGSLQPYKEKFAALQRKGVWSLQPYRGKECEVCSITEDRWSLQPYRGKKCEVCSLTEERSLKFTALQRKRVWSLQPYKQRKPDHAVKGQQLGISPKFQCCSLKERLNGPEIGNVWNQNRELQF